MELRNEKQTMVEYTEQERKQIGLIKCWVKIGSPTTFAKDWVKLQEDFVDRLGLLGGRVYINKTMDMLEEYINENGPK
tara:strand:- start:491 stop:724 length:234 start_codon:yes stop_codon:yes gene_type:complete